MISVPVRSTRKLIVVDMGDAHSSRPTPWCSIYRRPSGHCLPVSCLTLHPAGPGAIGGVPGLHRGVARGNDADQRGKQRASHHGNLWSRGRTRGMRRGNTRHPRENRLATCDHGGERAMRASRIIVALVLSLTMTAVVRTQDPPASQGAGQPTFRTGVNVVRVDVIATDSRGNPVPDLAKEEFEIVEDGRPQTIDFFRQIRIDAAASDASRPRQVLSRDTEEREASRDDVRVFAIMLADYQICAQRSRLVREALSSFINQ